MKTPTVNFSPKLPAYALDGRTLEWNAERTAVRFDSTNEEYHSDRNAVSSSMLKVLDRSPAHLREYLLTPQQSKSAFVLGSAIHCAVLEPADFAQRFHFVNRMGYIITEVPYTNDEPLDVYDDEDLANSLLATNECADCE